MEVYILQAQLNSIYYAIYSDIKNQILRGELQPGDQLPSEPELEKRYNASRAPVRQALSMLEHESFLTRCQGRGTFVCDRKKESRWLLSGGFAKDMERDFNEIDTKILWVRMESPSETVQDSLMLDDGQQVIHIHRLRYFKGIPLFSIHSYMKDSLNINVFKRAGNFFIISEVLERDFQISLYRAEEEIRAASADSLVAQELQIEIGTPLLKGIRTYYTENNRPVYISEYFVRTDHWAHRTTYYAKV